MRGAGEECEVVWLGGMGYGVRLGEFRAAGSEGVYIGGVGNGVDFRGGVVLFQQDDNVSESGTARR